MKKLFCFASFAIIFGLIFFAKAQNDCRLLDDGFNTNSNYFENIESVYPKSDIQVAMNHLVYYCCENGYAKNYSSCPKKKPDGTFVDKKLYAQSPFLYDHILDIGMRRLDGDINRQYQEAGLDNIGAKRRNRIRTASRLTSGIAPISVLTKYQELRKPGIKDDDAFPSSNIKVINQKYKDYGLKNRYFAMCYVVDYIESIINPKINVNGNLKLQGQTKKCFGLVDEIIQQEFSYTKWVMIQQGARLVSHSMDTYTDDYFTRGRLQPVLEKIAKMQAIFLMVNQKVNEGTNQCTPK